MTHRGCQKSELDESNKLIPDMQHNQRNKEKHCSRPTSTIGARETAAPPSPSMAETAKKGLRSPPYGPAGVIPVPEGSLQTPLQRPSNSKMAANPKGPSDTTQVSETQKRLDKIFEAFWRKLEERQATARDPAGNSPPRSPSHAHLRRAPRQKKYARQWRRCRRRFPPTSEKTQPNQVATAKPRETRPALPKPQTTPGYLRGQQANSNYSCIPGTRHRQAASDKSHPDLPPAALHIREQTSPTSGTSGWRRELAEPRAEKQAAAKILEGIG